MEQNQIKSLKYRIEVNESEVVYREPSPINGEQEAFDYALSDGVLVCTLRGDFESIDDARRVVKTFLRAWEVKAVLDGRRGSPKFVFEGAEMTSAASSQTLFVPRGELRLVGGKLDAVVTENVYSEPPLDFSASDEVEILFLLYRGYLKERIPLPMMAYACLSLVEKLGDKKGSGKNKRRQAADYFGVEFEVLNRIARLSSTKGHDKISRKYDGSVTPEPLTNQEIDWLLAAVRAVIKRVGHPHPADAPKITTSLLLLLHAGGNS